MHSKLMLLFHSEYLRIVVPTANLIQVDWGAQNVMENVSSYPQKNELPEILTK